MAQVLELQVSVLISVFKDQFNVEIDLEKLILREDKKTLGILIGELKKHANLDEAGSRILREALMQRNYIAHHFFNRNVYAFADEDTFELAMGKLKEDTKTIGIATCMTQGFVEGFCQALKLTKNDILIRQDT